MDDLFKDSSKTGSVDYSELLRKFLYRAKTVLRCHWWVVPAALAVGVTYKAVEGYLEDPYYESTAEMIVSGRIALPEDDVYAEEGRNFYGTQIELMTSSQVRQRAIERVELTHPEVHSALTRTDAFREDGFKTLALAAEVKEDTDIFQLYAYSPHPEYTRLYLDAVMEAYVNRRSEMRSRTSERTFEGVQAQLKELEAEIDAGENAIVEFQEQNNIVFIQEQGSAAGAYLADLQRRLAELNTESRALSAIGTGEEAETIILDELKSSGVEEGEASGNALVDAVGSPEDNLKYLTAKEELETLEAQLEEFSIYLKPKHPRIIELKDRIERTDNQLQIYRRQALDRIRERRQVVESRIRNLSQEIEIWERSALENGRLIAEFERLQSRLERAKAAYERNQEALRAIESNENLQQETISVLTEARSPRPSGPGTVRRFVEGGIYGLLLAGGILLVISTMDNRILTASEVGGLFDEPLLGVIPYQREIASENEGNELLQKNDERYVFAEACRNLRTSVFFMEKDGAKPGVLAVTSAVPSEGKSTVSANLAVALSFSQSKVLLVDADLRRGRLHKLFKDGRERGLADYLEGAAGIDEVLQRTGYPNLDFISIGEYPDQPAELLMNDRMDELIRTARQRYDFVLFDTAPILATDDTTCFASKMDAVLFTIRCAHTQIRQIRPAMARLKERKIDVSGLILNCVDTSQPGYYYYRYAEYYTSPNADGKPRRARPEASGQGVTTA